jgi:hypothetical protein
MRYVPSIPPVTTSPITREVNAVSAVHAVRAVHAPDKIVPQVEIHTAYQGSAIPVVVQQQHQIIPAEDRRKYCRRVSHMPVLEELRSGIDRRHHDLLGGSVVEHIDEIV